MGCRVSAQIMESNIHAKESKVRAWDFNIKHRSTYPAVKAAI